MACGPDMLVYKNVKPYFKFTVPPMEVTPLEVDVWKKLQEDPNSNVQNLLDGLKNIPYPALSPRCTSSKPVDENFHILHVTGHKSSYHYLKLKGEVSSKSTMGWS